jgi:uncharacterized protein (DUF58 family)
MAEPAAREATANASRGNLRDMSLEIGERLGSRPRLAAAQRLAAAMPRLTADARRAAASVVAGVHGRRRAGQGESFWQYRAFTSGESAHRIDWRRSARDDRLYVREREWEAAHTIWLSIDRSPSMDFRSGASPMTKLERAVVLGLAAADMLVRGGERVGLIQTTQPMASRRIIERLADALMEQGAAPKERTHEPLSSRSEAIILSDFISEPKRIDAMVGILASRGAKGHLVLIRDPAEEHFPFSGQTEFSDPEGSEPLRVGEAASLAGRYREKIEAHREAVIQIARKYGWGFHHHITDQPASACLMRLSMAMSGGA